MTSRWHKAFIPASAAILFGAAAAVFGTAPATAAVLYSQGFETNTAGWSDGNPYGSIARVSSGTGGVTSFAGGFHGHATGTSQAYGPYTFFGGPSSGLTGPVAFSSSIAVYLDLGWSAGSGFDYSVAASNQSGGHLRDFIFHIYKGADDIIVGGSNNSNFQPQARSGQNHYVVDNSGWYILEHQFYDQGGVLAVDLNLRADDGTILFTETRTTATDDFDTVYGGNRYGWFTHVSIQGGIDIDAASLQTTAVPEPGSLALLGLGLTGIAFAGRRRRTR